MDETGTSATRGHAQTIRLLNDPKYTLVSSFLSDDVEVYETRNSLRLIASMEVAATRSAAEIGIHVIKRFLLFTCAMYAQSK